MISPELPNRATAPHWAKYLLVALLSALAGAALLFALLEPRGPGGGAPAPEPQEHATMFICPMHPQIIRDHKASCPLCGMDLVAMQEEEGASGAAGDATGAVHVEAAMIQSIGVKTMVVAERDLAYSVTLTGTLGIDPERISVLNTRAMGWIESVPYGSIGARVKRGQKLADFYSPDLVAAQEDLLQALLTQDEALIAGARNRLEVLGVAATLIDSIATQGSARRTLPLTAPLSGVILEKQAVQGQNVMPGADLYRFADLSRVWVVAQAYPEQLGGLKAGMKATVAFPQGSVSTAKKAHSPTLPTGRILFIAPTVDPSTKSAEIRVDLANTPDLAYKPGMSADLRIESALGRGIAIPSQAVIRTGERTVAIVGVGAGHFAPRELRLGWALGDSVQVLGGLEVGDTLVTSAQFLIDSESNLRKAVEAFARPASVSSDSVNKTAVHPVPNHGEAHVGPNH